MHDTNTRAHTQRDKLFALISITQQYPEIGVRVPHTQPKVKTASNNILKIASYISWYIKCAHNWFAYLRI